MVLLVGSHGSADAAEPWRIHRDVGVLERVTLRIHWYENTVELREAAKDIGLDIELIGLHGLSVLRRNTVTGEYVCELFVLRVTRTGIDHARTTNFGHEVLHCFGLKHD